MVEVGKVAFHHVLIIPTYLFSAAQKAKNMGIVINGKMITYLVIQVRDRLVTWNFQEEI